MSANISFPEKLLVLIEEVVTKHFDTKDRTAGMDESAGALDEASFNGLLEKSQQNTQSESRSALACVFAKPEGSDENVSAPGSAHDWYSAERISCCSQVGRVYYFATSDTHMLNRKAT